MSYAECYDQENVIAGETSLIEIIFIDSKCYLLAYLKHPSELKYFECVCARALFHSTSLVLIFL